MVDKTKKTEAEYFARIERERKAQAEIRRRQEEAEAERALHYMKCPKCGQSLEATWFREVEVDRCTQCQGVWLDPGELEKLAGRDSHALSDLLAFFVRPSR